MDPESKKLFEETFALAKENNKMLHSMRRSMFYSRVVSIIYWVFIIGSALGVYYFIEPYFNKILDLYNSISTTQQQLNNTPIKELLKKY